MSDETRTSRGGAGGEPAGQVDLAAGSEFAGHRIESEIGRGGMGVVYRARHVALDRDRALKVIAPALSADSSFRERFRRESRLAASIEHPNVIAVHHAGEEAGQLYISMRLVEGADLRRIVGTKGPLPPERVGRLISGVASGLDAAHARGLVHRDVKPANVLIERGNGGERVFLTDFGISRIAGPGGTLTSSGEVLGSVDYVAPEQIEGAPVDGRTDIYALGCVLHFALTGQPPFPRENDLAKLFAHANGPRPKPSELVSRLPPGLDDVVARAMALRPDDRYPTAGELAADLERAAGGSAPVGAASLPPRPAPRHEAATGRLHRAGRRRNVAVAAGLAALVAAGVVAALVIGGDEQGGPGATLPSGPQPRPTATIDVGREPNGLTVGKEVLVSSRGQAAVDTIDPRTDRAVGTPLEVGGTPVSVARGFGAIWAVEAASNSVVRLDPKRPAARPLTIPVGANPSDVAVDRRSVWVTNESDDSVSRIDPSTNRVDKTIPISADAGPRSIAAGAGGVWVANIDGRSVSEIDPQAARIVGKPIPLGSRPNDLAIGEGYLWVTDVFDGTVAKVDPDAMETVGAPIDVGARPRGIKTGFGYVWVANGGDGTVTRVDPKAGAPAGPPIPVGKNPADIAVGKGAVWTANFDDSTVTKIRP